jgi:hypothetical protein
MDRNGWGIHPVYRAKPFTVRCIVPALTLFGARWPAPPTLLDLGLEGLWGIETGDSEAVRIGIEREGRALRLVLVSPDQRREAVGVATVESDLIRFDFVTEKMGTLVARAKPSATREWDVRWVNAPAECSGGEVALQASPDLHEWRARVACPSARPPSFDYTAALEADGTMLTVTAAAPGRALETMTLRREH